MLEEQRAQVVQLQAMRNAAQASKQTMQELDIQFVEDVLDEINEQADQMAHIEEAMAQPMGGAAALDEDELLAELEARFPLDSILGRNFEFADWQLASQFRICEWRAGKDQLPLAIPRPLCEQ